MTRLETETLCYWRAAQLAHHGPLISLATSGLTCLHDIAEYAHSPALRMAAGRHLRLTAAPPAPGVPQ